jgi:predicted Zn finger-like uncharacterized protein
LRIGCPHCLTRYELPESLLGTGGARVRCPSCQQLFVVTPQGEAQAVGHDSRTATHETARVALAAPEAEARVTAERSAPHAAAAAAASASTAADPLVVARQVLDELERAHGDAIGLAIERGRLFSEQGDKLVEAFDEFRRRTQRRADAGPFREVLRERWGVDLTPHWDDR